MHSKTDLKPKQRTPKQRTVLILCAHPDDEIFGAGGTIAKYNQEGKKVVAVIFSYGEKSHWWMKKKYTVEKRVKESKEAGRIVGISETIFLGLKDLELKSEAEKPDTLKLIEKTIKKYKPFRIFTHSIDDVVFQDHKAVHEVVMKATNNINFKGDIYTFNIWAKDIRTSRNPKLLVDIRDTFGLKLKALNCFVSQKLVLLQLLPSVYGKAIAAGFENRCRFAEKFTKIK